MGSGSPIVGSAIEIVGLSLQKWGCAERPILMSALQLHADQCRQLLSYFIICSAWRYFAPDDAKKLASSGTIWRRFWTVPIHYVAPAGTFMLDNVNDIIPATASATDGNRNHNDGAPNRYCFFFCNQSNIYWIFIAYKRHQRLKEEAGTRDAYVSWARGTFFIFILFDHSQINTRPLIRPPLPHPS